jgi:hypothetical protein
MERTGRERLRVSRSIGIVSFGLLIICTAAQAKTQYSCERNCAECHTLSQAEASIIFKGLGEVKNIRMSPVKGLWLITLEKDGRQGVAYLDFARKNIIAGDVFSLEPDKREIRAHKQADPVKP